MEDVDSTEMPVHVNLRYSTSEKELIDLLFMAIDRGGSRHWATAIDVGRAERGMRNYLTAMFTHRRGTDRLTLEKLQSGLQVVLDKYPACFAEIVDGSVDASGADALVQCALFGDWVFE